MKSDEPVTVEWVLAEVAKIETLALDRYSPDAHFADDGLREAVLRAIASGSCADPAGCAAAALKTEDITMTRWYE